MSYGTQARCQVVTLVVSEVVEARKSLLRSFLLHLKDAIFFDPDLPMWATSESSSSAY